MAWSSTRSTGRPVTSAMPAIPHMSGVPGSSEVFPLVGIVNMPARLSGRCSGAVHREAAGATLQVIGPLYLGIDDVCTERVGATVEQKRVQGQPQHASLYRRGDLHRVGIGDNAAQRMALDILYRHAEDRSGQRLDRGI